MDRNRAALMRRWVGCGLLLTPILFLLIFFFYPLGSILEYSFLPDQQLDLSGFLRLIERPYYRETLWFTTWQALLATFLTLALAIPGAHVFSRYQFPGKSVLLSLATLPFVLPTVVVAAAFIALIGENSTLNQWLMDRFNLDQPPIRLERTLTLILIAHVFYNYAVALRIISTFWANQNRRMQEAAQVLGANRATVFVRITIPLLLPAIMAAGALVFMFTFTSFGVILLLGGLGYTTLETEIYYQAISLFNWQVAGALSVVQLLATLLMLVMYSALQRRMSQPLTLQSSRATARPPKNWRERLWISVNLLVIVILIFAPLLALIERSLTVGDQGLTTRYYQALSENPRRSIIFVPPTEAIWNSLRYAIITTILSLIFGTIAAYALASEHRWSRWLDPVFMLPLATSAVTLGFGYVVALSNEGILMTADSWIREIYLELAKFLPLPEYRQSLWLIPVVHTLIAMPFVVRSVLPSLRAIRPSVREAAGVLGASAWQRWWRIEFPLIARSMMVGATFAFTISMGEFGAALFLARPQEPTIPIVISRFLGTPGTLNYGQALAMSVILMAVCAAGFILIDRLNRSVIGEF